MSVLEFLLLLLVAGICGSIAQSVAGYSRGGCLTSIVLGFIGALLGTWLSRQLALPDLFTVQVGSQLFPIIWSVIGASLFVAVLSFIATARRRRRSAGTLLAHYLASWLPQRPICVLLRR